jgi:hypothetical protein
VQLKHYLNDGGLDKLNVIAISWTEGRYGNASESRLRSMVREFHPAIRVIRATDEIDKTFSPLVYVPANFLFDGKGKRAFGDGSRHYLSRNELTKLVNGLN